MKTTDRQPANEQSQKARVVIMEYLSASKGQHSYTVLYRNDDGSKMLLGRIYREYNPEMKKNIYTMKDPQGNLLIEPTENLYQLKKQIKDKAKEMAQAIQDNEQDVSSGQMRQPIQKQAEEKRKGKSIVQKAQQITHSLVPEKITSDRPEVDKIMEQSQREHELKEKRKERVNGKDKGLNR